MAKVTFNNKLKLLQKNIPQICSYFCFTILITIVFLWVGIETSMRPARTQLASVLCYFGDAALISSILLWVRKYRVWIYSIVLFVVSLFSVIGVWYYRFWHEYPGFSSIILIDNFDSNLIKSIGALWRWGDLLIIGVPVILWLISERLRKKSTITIFNKKSVDIILFFTGIAFYLVSQFIHSHSFKNYLNEGGASYSLMDATKIRLSEPLMSNKLEFKKNGIIPFFIKSGIECFTLFNLFKDLNEEDKFEIDSFIKNTPLFLSLPDSVIEINKEKNIILILVESLNSEVINRKVDNILVAPVLHNLSKEKGTLTALNIRTQIRNGCSGDGQLMTNTGLLPIKEFSTAICFGSRNSFPGLPRVLGRNDNIVIFGDDATVWNEYQTFKSFGFESIQTCKDYTSLIELYGGDGGLFRYASTLIPNLEPPFLIELLTVSMHLPFVDKHIPANQYSDFINEINVENEIERNYLSMVHYFDCELGKFISQLKAQNIWDKTILIIVSDHPQIIGTNKKNKSLEEINMGLIIVNCGMEVTVTNQVSQIDVYPTILHLTGTSGPNGWMGVGNSILNGRSFLDPTTIDSNIEREDSMGKLEMEKGDRISTLIHQTDYFGKRYYKAIQKK